jgi:hypothetical protein
MTIWKTLRSMNARNWKNVAQIETVGKGWLSKPEPYTGCSALEEEEVNPLPVQFKSLLPWQKGCVFFSPQQQTNIPT